jgi:hypothetical protein
LASALLATGEIYFTVNGSLIERPVRLSPEAEGAHLVVSYNELANMPGIASCRLVLDSSAWMYRDSPEPEQAELRTARLPPGARGTTTSLVTRPSGMLRFPKPSRTFPRFSKYHVRT